MYAHAGAAGIAPVGAPEKEFVISWSELARALPKGVRYLWLLGCKTEKACTAWKSLQGPVIHRLLATSESIRWVDFIRFFALEISLDPIHFDDEMADRLRQHAPELAKHTQYFDSDLRPLKRVSLKEDCPLTKARSEA